MSQPWHVAIPNSLKIHLVQTQIVNNAKNRSYLYSLINISHFLVAGIHISIRNSTLKSVDFERTNVVRMFDCSAASPAPCMRRFGSADVIESMEIASSIILFFFYRK